MTAYALLFTLAAMGISETAYLVRKRRELSAPVCPIGEDCAMVLESRYNQTFIFIHNDLAGLLFYVAAAVMSAFLVNEMAPVLLWQTLLEGMVAAGALFSLYLLYLQWKIIKAWCFWCVMSAFTIFAMGLILTI